MAAAVFDELDRPEPKRHFTVGIVDDVTHLSLRCDPSFTTERDDVVRAVFYGLGSDGTVGANKNSVKIIGENTPLLRPGLLRLRLEEVGLDDRLAPAVRPAPDPLHLPDRAGELRRLPPVRASWSGSTCSEWPQPGRDLPAQQPLSARTRSGSSCRARSRSRSSTRSCGSTWSTPIAWRSEAGLGGRINTVHADLLLRAGRASCRATRRSPAIKESIEKTYGKRGETVLERNFAAVDGALGRAPRGAPSRPAATASRHGVPPVARRRPRLRQAGHGA